MNDTRILRFCIGINLRISRFHYYKMVAKKNHKTPGFPSKIFGRECLYRIYYIVCCSQNKRDINITERIVRSPNPIIELS